MPKLDDKDRIMHPGKEKRIAEEIFEVGISAMDAESRGDWDAYWALMDYLSGLQAIGWSQSYKRRKDLDAETR